MRQLFTVGSILTALTFANSLRAETLPLVEVRLEAHDRDDLFRVASADTPAEMVRALVGAHRDLALQTVERGPARYTPRFAAGPGATLALPTNVKREEVLAAYLRYLIDRQRLRRHAPQTIGHRRAYLDWIRASGGGRVAGLRAEFEESVLRDGEPVEIALFLRRHARALHLESTAELERAAVAHLLNLARDWERVVRAMNEPREPGEGTHRERLARAGFAIGRAYTELPCAPWLVP